MTTLSKTAVEYGFEPICNDNSGKGSNEINMDNNYLNNNNALINEMSATNYD